MPVLQLLNKSPEFSSSLGEVLGSGLGMGLSEGLEKQLSAFYNQKNTDRLENAFKSQGYPEDLAKLAAMASTGGQTEILKQLLELRQRQSPQVSEFLSEEKSPSDDFMEETVDVGLTPKERFRREEGRFGKQSEKYGELSEKNNKFHQEQMRLQRLQELNESGSLPKGLGRLNVNLKSGELLLPFAASTDAQEFGKIVNDFLSGAKDTFGARVTNFEVNRFLRRLPSLLNSQEGRRRVLRDMEIINQINSLHNQAILDEFDQRGGVRKVDLDVAERSARKKIDPLIKKLQKEYVSGSQEGEKQVDAIVMIDPSGKKRRVSKKDAKKAQEAGYKLAS